MRTQIAVGVILVASLLGSARIAAAQTGEFASPVPGSTMRDAWEMQDQLQRARSRASVKIDNPAAPSYGEPNAAKPQGGVTTINGAKTRE
jgi:hypothetical protein